MQAPAPAVRNQRAQPSVRLELMNTTGLEFASVCSVMNPVINVEVKDPWSRRIDKSWFGSYLLWPAKCSRPKFPSRISSSNCGNSEITVPVGPEGSITRWIVSISTWVSGKGRESTTKQDGVNCSVRAARRNAVNPCLTENPAHDKHRAPDPKPLPFSGALLHRGSRLQ